MNNKKNRKAFTLIELLIVVAILGLLAGIIAPSIMGKFGKAKQDLTCNQMKGIGQALETFKLENGVYPDTEEGLDALVKNPDAAKYPTYAGPYMGKGKLPKDSWSGTYQYVNTGDNYDIISLGADRKEGGEGNKKDLYLSKCFKK